MISARVCFSFFACSFQSIDAFFEFLLLFLDFIVKSLYLVLVQILQFLLFFAMLPDEVCS